MYNVFNIVMSSSYVAPPAGTQREGPVNPVPQDYHHLESNRALLHPPTGPPCSENMVLHMIDTSCIYMHELSTQAQFAAPLKSETEAKEQMRAAQTERKSRIEDNKHTHLVLGFDSTPPLSEKVSSAINTYMYRKKFNGVCVCVLDG